MARITTIAKEEHLEFLKTKIVLKFGNKISTSTDCEYLNRCMGNSVSIDTLRRIFKLIKKETKVSKPILDACAIYCGFKNWEVFIEEYNVLHRNKLKTLLIDCVENKVKNEELFFIIESQIVEKEVYSLFTQLILIKVIQKDKCFFENIFESETLFINTKKYRYEIYYVIHLLGALCNQNKWLQKIAIKNYFNLPYDDDLFVEWLVNPEQEYYRKLLLNYYKSKKSNPSSEAFFHLIMATYFADIKNWDEFKSHYNSIITLDFDKIKSNILLMRKYGIEVIYQKNYKKEDAKTSVENISKIDFSIEYKDISDRVTSILFISEYLYKCNELQTIINIIKKHLGSDLFLLTHWGNLNWNQLQIILAGSLYFTNEIPKCKSILDTLSKNQLNLNFFPFSTIIYNDLVMKLNMQKCVLKT